MTAGKKTMKTDAKLIATTRRYLAYIDKTSLFFEKCPSRSVPHFEHEQCWAGKILGMGEFGVVSEVSNLVADDDEEIGSSEHVDKRMGGREAMDVSEAETVELSRTSRSSRPGTKKYMKENIFRDGMARYAVKTLRKALTDGDQGDDYLTSAVLDLALEAKFLASLSHPNIVKIRGTIGTPGSRRYALILDRLYLTMDEAIGFWRAAETRRFGDKLLSTKLGRKLFSKQKEKQQSDLSSVQCERLAALGDVARALSYLHANNIVYRDLKPQNVGQDVRGDFRIFDFGLAKELPSNNAQPAEDQYKMTALVGTKRYMAPEVARSDDYGLAVDVYSFGLLFWQVCSLKTPFGNMSQAKHSTNVVIKGQRPPTQPAAWIGDELVALMKRCWAADPRDRPVMTEICDGLRRKLDLTERKKFRGRSMYLAEQSMRSWRARVSLEAMHDDGSESL